MNVDRFIVMLRILNLSFGLIQLVLTILNGLMKMDGVKKPMKSNMVQLIFSQA
jgi:hypothetical protein